MSSAANINKLWTTTSWNFISLNWRTAKSLTTFYLEKIYCEFLRTCTRNYYKKCMINLQSSIFHFDNKWIINLVQRFYYWSDHWATIQWYIWNCHACQQSKVSRNSINELHHSLSISQKRWKDITMNFITELYLSEDYNVICTIICCFIKERHYVFCH